MTRLPRTDSHEYGAYRPIRNPDAKITDILLQEWQAASRLWAATTRSGQPNAAQRS